MVDPVSTNIAIAVAKVLAQWVTSRALDEVSLGRDFKNQLEKLNKKFGYIQAFLDDISYSAISEKSSLVNLWLQNVKDAAYKADDVMDEYAVEIFRRRIEARNPMEEFFNDFFKPSNHVLFHFNMAHKVKDILSLLDEIDKDAREISLNKVDLAASSSGTQSHHGDRHLSQLEIVNASEYVGRRIHQEKLLNFICCPPVKPHLSTVAIVGMGGVGKTTLTTHLYNHERVCAEFGSNKILIYVSLKFDVIEILNEMIESRTSSKLYLTNTDALKRELQKELSGKKLFLVLDNVWNDDHDSWKSLKELLNETGIAQGSVILINSRSDQVVKAAKAEFIYKLQGLSKAKSWSLLHQIIFNNSISSIDLRMEEVGKRIVEKCKGVPLAIKKIGNLLQSKQHLNEWETIDKSELWDLPYGQNHIFPSLLLSFNILPSSSVKQCFAYCAVLPKGFLVSKIELIGLWLSQGYIREEIGEENLEILLSNSLLERVSLGQGLVGYKMHDLLYGLAVFVCGSDLIKEMRDPGKIANCRHLIISSTDDTAMADLPPEMTLPKLRTLGLKGGIITLNKIHATHLRTLFLNQSGIEEVPPAVALLKHLRYLDLSFNPISTLPESMGKLYQLQTLILQGTKIKTLPRVLYTLVNLRHIPTTGLVFEMEESQPLTDPSSLSFLSEDEDIDANVDVVANGDDDEDRDENEIAVLEYKSENEDVFRIVEHESVRDKMFPGNEFHILGLECVNDKEQARKFGLAGKPNVTNLYLSWAAGRQDTCVGNCDEDVLAGLEPHPNIKSIEVQNFLGEKFPTWITGMAVVTGEPSGNRTQLNNLTVLKLLNCRECRTLPNLGQLHHLNNLNLNGFYVGTIGMEFYGGDHLDNPDVVSFKSLKELEVSEFYVLSNWMEPPVGAFPVLETLRIRDCDLLESVPVLGFTSLTSLELRNLKSVESLDIIKYSLGLTSLIMSMLPKIESLPQELADCRMLQTLHISDFHKLASVPSGLESLVNLKSKVVNLRDISAIAPTLILKESHQLTNLQSLPLLSLDDDDGCSTNKLEDLHLLSDEFPILGPECAKADEQVGESLESKEDMEQAGKEINLARTSLESAKDEDLVGKNLECVEDNELTKETVECVINKKLSLKCVEDSELMGISLEGVKDKEIASKSFEGVEEEEMTGKSLEGAKDKELAENSLECVKDSELVGKSREGAVNKDVVGKSLECVKDKEIVGYGLEGIDDSGITGKSLEVVEDEEHGVAWWAKANYSWVDGSGLQQLTNLGEINGGLQITGLECVKDKEKARKVGLAGKANVTWLHLVWTKGRGETGGGVWDEDVLEALEPHPNITSLEVHNFLGVKFPPWIMEMIKWTRFVNLTEVKLLNCSRCQTLPTLGHLPLLRSLILSGFDVETIDVEFYGSYSSDLSEKLLPNSRRDIVSTVMQAGGWEPEEMSFRSLLELNISGFCRLTTWNEPPKAAFPCLDDQVIRDCCRLESVPTLSSKTLKFLELESLNRVRSLDIIKFNCRDCPILRAYLRSYHIVRSSRI